MKHSLVIRNTQEIPFSHLAIWLFIFIIININTDETLFSY
jgi:hypothetical protein